jgi:hypothetical protein
MSPIATWGKLTLSEETTMLREELKPLGRLTLTLTDEFGNIKDQNETNMVVNSGLSWITSRMAGNSDAVISHMAVGADTTGSTDGARTALGNQLAGRKAVTTARTTTNVTDDTVQYVTTFAAGESTGAITEAGLFNAATGGTMLSRTVFPVVNKGANDTLTITWDITLV